MIFYPQPLGKQFYHAKCQMGSRAQERPRNGIANYHFRPFSGIQREKLDGCHFWYKKHLRSKYRGRQRLPDKAAPTDQVRTVSAPVLHQTAAENLRES